MTLQKLELIPKEMFVQFEGSSLMIRPKVEYLGKEAREMPVLARQDGFEQVYTDNSVPVYTQLKAGKHDGYSSLAQKQPLVKAEKIRKDTMVDVLARFGEEVSSKYLIWSELGPDWEPQKRTEGYRLPENANAVLYRNWNLSEDIIDVSNAEVIPVKWMENSGDVSKEIIEKLNAPKDTYVYVDKEDAIKNYDGLNSLRWGFGFLGRPYLDSTVVPRYGGSGRGALLGSRLSADEMVKNFQEKVTISKYQAALNGLEKNLTGFETRLDKQYNETKKFISNTKKEIEKLKLEGPQ